MTHPSPRRLASNLLLRGGEILARPLITLDSRGYITSVEQYDTIDGQEGVEFYAGIMTAGFVNAHSHLELSYLRGQIEPHQGFAQFAREIGRLREQTPVEERLRAIRRADMELRAAGVVAVGDIVNGQTSMACKSHSQIEYRNFGELFGLQTTSAEHLGWLAEYPNSSLTLHSTYSVGDALFRDVAAQDNNAPLSIHFLESRAEVELFARRGELWEWYQSVGFECDFLHYGSAARRIVESLPASRSVMLVHCCHTTQRDIDTIMSHFTAPVYWVLCPCSNSYISEVSPPVELLRKNGLNICLGTDSLASNSSLSMLNEMASLGSRVPLNELLDWATRQGARALGFNELGDIEVGKCPGINIISGVDYRAMSLTPNSVARLL